jgi:hypothetical protein
MGLNHCNHTHKILFIIIVFCFFFSFFFNFTLQQLNLFFVIFNFNLSILGCLEITLHNIFRFCFSIGLYTGLMDLVFFFWLQPSILDMLEVRLYNFLFHSMNLSLSHYPGHRFNRLTWVIFFSFSNWFLFLFHPSTLSWLKIRPYNVFFFFFAFYKVILISWPGLT